MITITIIIITPADDIEIINAINSIGIPAPVVLVVVVVDDVVVVVVGMVTVISSNQSYSNQRNLMT